MKDTHKLKAKRWKKICYANGKKQARVVILISDKEYSKRQRRTLHSDKGNN